MTAAIAAPVPAVRPAPLDRLPGTSGDDPFLRLAAGWLVGHPANTAKAYRRDLEGWAAWSARLGVHPLAAERHHVDAWVRHLTTEPQPRTGRPASAATVARKLSALAGFYDFGVHDAGVHTHSPAASVRRPKVSDESQAIGLTAEELRRLLAAANAHSRRSEPPRRVRRLQSLRRMESWQDATGSTRRSCGSGRCGWSPSAAPITTRSGTRCAPSPRSSASGPRRPCASGCAGPRLTPAPARA